MYAFRQVLYACYVSQGGLGHVAVKFLKSFGVHTTVIEINDGKRQSALQHLGADNFLLATDEAAMKVRYQMTDTYTRAPISVIIVYLANRASLYLKSALNYHQ